MTVNVLFVCLGNICRSPAAEAIFHRLVADAGLSDLVRGDSCGTGDYHIGEPPDPRMRRHLQARGCGMEHRGRQFREPDDFNRFQYVVTMDEQNHAAVRHLAATEAQAARLHRMTDFCRIPGVREVPDPYSGGPELFERVLDILEDACAGLLEHIRKHDLT
jgi:protein-tyrosine phosphatase